MFGLFRKKRSAQAEAIADIEKTLLTSFERLQNAAEDENPLTRRINIVAPLAATMAALREAYPGFPIEDQNMALVMIESNAKGPPDIADRAEKAIINAIKRCPNYNAAKIETMLYMLAPNRVGE